MVSIYYFVRNKMRHEGALDHIYRHESVIYKHPKCAAMGDLGRFVARFYHSNFETNPPWLRYHFEAFLV